MIHAMFKRWLRKYAPVSIYRPLRRPAFDVDVKLEREQEVARRVLVADGANVDRPIYQLIAVAEWAWDANGSPIE